MILEITMFDLKPGACQRFEEAVVLCRDLFERANGCRNVALYKSHETTDRYHLLVTWEKIENHTVDFWQSDDFKIWRSRVADCFLHRPTVQHAHLCMAQSFIGGEQVMPARVLKEADSL
jgi:heme-degrading monooxygenase HmoA